MCLRESSFTALQQGDINDLLRVSFPVQINGVTIEVPGMQFVNGTTSGKPRSQINFEMLAF